MKRFLAILACLVMMLISVRAQVPDDARVDSLFKAARTVGGSVVVYHQGRPVYARDYGYKHLGRREPVDEHTYFRTASITKMVTGIGLMTLVEKGLLGLDEDISTYFGYRVGNPYYPGTPITLRQMMSHTSSLRDEGGYNSVRNSVEDMLRLDNGRTGNFLQARPGSIYRYSNFAAGLTGALMEAVSGKSVNRYMRESVFAPMGIDAAYAAGLLENPADVSSQYRDGKTAKTASLSLKDPYEDTPDPQRHYRTTIGGLWMRSRDLARLTALLCNDGALAGVRLLSRQSVAQMMAPQHTKEGSVTADSPYGLFLERNDTLVSGKVFYGHQGMSSGAILNAYFEPASSFVIVVCSNGGSMARTNRVGNLTRSLIDYLYPLYAVGAQ